MAAHDKGGFRLRRRRIPEMIISHRRAANAVDK
jgi:hypothetical protein